MRWKGLVLLLFYEQGAEAQGDEDRDCPTDVSAQLSAYSERRDVYFSTQHLAIRAEKQGQVREISFLYSYEKHWWVELCKSSIYFINGFYVLKNNNNNHYPKDKTKAKNNHKKKNPEALGTQVLFTCALLLLYVQIILILCQVQNARDPQSIVAAAPLHLRKAGNTWNMQWAGSHLSPEKYCKNAMP